MDKLDQIKKKIEEIQAKSAVSKEMRAFIELVLGVVSKTKEELANLSQENLKVIKDSIAYIEAFHEKQVKLLDDKTNTVTEQFDARLGVLKALLAKVEAIKATPGKDGYTPVKGVDYFDGLPGKDGIGKDGSPDTRLQIVEKINTGKKKDLKIELSQIEDFTKLTKEIEARALSILDQRTKFLINKGVKHDNTLTGDGSDANPLSVTNSGGSGTPGGSDTQIQFNDSSSFGGDAGFTYNKTTNIATLGGLVTQDIHTVDANSGTTISVLAGSAVSGDNNGGDIQFDSGAKSGAGTDGVIDFTTPAGGTRLNGAIFSPQSPDTVALGSASLTWSDLYLAEGGVINWDNGDATLTQAGDVVTLAGADLKISSPGNASTSVLTTDATQTLTNKTLIATTNVVEEVTTTASSATPTPTGGSLRNFFTVTALAAGATFAAPSGSPANGNYLTIRIKDNGTARTLAFNAIYRFGDVAAPTTTVISKTLYLGFRYNSADSVWDCLAKVDNL